MEHFSIGAILKWSNSQMEQFSNSAFWGRHHQLDDSLVGQLTTNEVLHLSKLSLLTKLSKLSELSKFWGEVNGLYHGVFPCSGVASVKALLWLMILWHAIEDGYEISGA